MAKFTIGAAINALVNGAYLQNGANGDLFVPDRRYATIKTILESSGQTISNLAYDKEFVVCAVYNSINISVNSSSATILTFDTERTDPIGCHSTSATTGRITIPTGYDGVWKFTANIEFAATTSGTRRVVSLKLDGTTVIASDSRGVVSNNATVISVSVDYPVIAGQYVEVQVFHDAATALNVNRASDYSPTFSAHLVARIV